MITRELINEYNKKFPNTITTMHINSLSDDRLIEIEIEMHKAIDGNRGALSDKEIYSELPNGALI